MCWAELWFNTTYYASAQIAPFKTLYGKDPPTLLKGDVVVSAVEEVSKLLAKRNAVLEELKWHLNLAQN